MSLHKQRVVDSTNAYNVDEDVVDEIITAKEKRNQRKDEGYNVAVVNFVGDLLHAPHIQYIQLVNAQLREMLDYPHKLMIGTEYDPTTEKRKGKRNIYNHRERQYMLQNIKGVDHAFISWSDGETRPYPTTQYLEPDVFVSHVEYYPTQEMQELGHKICNDLGMLFLCADDIHKPRLLNQDNLRDKRDRSTTNTIKQIISMYKDHPKYQ